VIVEHEGVAAWYQQVYNYDWGIADCDATGEVNVGWDPYIPTSSSEINVTVYAHRLYNNVEDVKLGVKIDNGAWSNTTITSNVYESDEGVDENYFHVISAQPDGTNITVQAYVQALGVWYRGIQLVIPVRDDLGTITTPTPPTSPTTTPPTTPTTPPPTTPNPLLELLAEYGIYIVAAIAAVVLAVVFKKRS
jgi:hypothetical protein